MSKDKYSEFLYFVHKSDLGPGDKMRLFDMAEQFEKSLDSNYWKWKQ